MISSSLFDTVAIEDSMSLWNFFISSSFAEFVDAYTCLTFNGVGGCIELHSYNSVADRVIA